MRDINKIEIVDNRKESGPYMKVVAFVDDRPVRVEYSPIESGEWMDIREMEV